MEDTLSGYVELADSNYKVVAKDASGKVVSLTKNVDYTLTYDASTKKFTVAFLKPLVNNVTYTLEYNVKPTQKAYDEYGVLGRWRGSCMRRQSVSASGDPGGFLDAAYRKAVEWRR